ncbi:MAG TPA: hypothetical protein VFM27_19165, partial [Acidimicrobiales bacterium]|nr:hypothetical protein [Acidimicrobiales bacterium]
MPDKRNDPKQRRAARNRATRDALAARRENAVAAAAAASSAGSGGGSGGSTTAGRRGSPAPAGASPPPPSGLMGMLRSRRPGDRAVLLSVLFALVSVIFLLFVRVDVDDRGDAIPPTYGGTTILAREAITGEPVPDRTETLLSASGPGVLAVMALPVLVTLFAFWGNRRPDRGRMLTFAMFGMLAAVLVTGGLGIYFLPSLIAIGFASFQVRRLEMPARLGERRPPRGRRGRVIDAESRAAGVNDDVTDDDVTDDVTDEVAGDEVIEAEVVDEREPLDEDALAELEAELAAEEAADEG